MHKPIPGGFLLVIEGIDGAGKTTQAMMLADACGKLSLACEESKEPTAGQYGALLRQSAATGRLTLDRELELFTLDRKEHVERKISPALEAGKIVILDRYFYSTMAYQGARGADIERVLADNIAFAPIPDLLIILDVPCEVGLERIRRRGDQPNLFERKAMLTRARLIFKGAQHPCMKLINATLPIDKIHEDILGTMKIVAANKISERSGLTGDAVNRVGQLLYGSASN